MRRIFAALAAALLLSAAVPVSAAEELSSAAPAKAQAGVTINVYNWGEYISAGGDGSLDVNAEFTKETGIRVNYTTFEDNESMYSKIAGGGASYDVIFPSDYMVSKMIRDNLLQKLDFQNIPNFRYIGKDYRNPVYDPENEYSVPYSWGLVGIFYNKKYVKEKVDSWKILWNEKYAG